jgi:putative transposase
MSIIVTSEDAPVRELGRDLALDWGLSSALFATDDGRLLGRGILARLVELDRILTPHTTDLQRRGVRLRTDPYFQQLNRRIGDFMTNEVNRLLNRLATEQIRSFNVEALDFRHGGLSKPMNRIITRAGRAAVQAKLDRLLQTHGITTVKVPAPYSSQQCSGCDYTHKTNRRSQARFRCRFCGKKLHADVNSARSLAKRRSLGIEEGSGPRARKNILLVLDTQHRKRWGLPVPGAIPGVAGAPGEQAA